jgi:hypothetical protein
MTDAQIELNEVLREMNRIELNNLQYKDETGSAGCRLAELEDKRIVLQEIVDEEEREEAFNNGAYGVGA